jgi:molybdopterin-guanine dinucleotide biosynthesis protein A
VAGTALVARVRDALAEVVTRPVVITAQPEIARAAGLPSRADAVAGIGPLAGIETALRWAAELGLPGALCVACDLPFLSPGLLRLLVGRGLETGAPAVLPESAAPAGFEPLCAWYAVAALPAVESALRSGERSVTRTIGGLGALRVPLAEVASQGDPALLFLNVNTPEGQRRADAAAARARVSRG